MKDRAPFGLNWALSAWNLFLALFSLAGAVRVVPQIALNVYLLGFEYTICERADSQYGLGASGFWVALFILSKPFELIDTFFIVMRKKPLILLHWVRDTIPASCAHLPVSFSLSLLRASS